MEDFVENFSESVNTPVIDEEDLVTIQEIDKIGKDLDDLLADLK